MLSAIETMVCFAPMNVTFYFGGWDFIVSGWASIREIFIYGVEVPMIHARIGSQIWTSNHSLSRKLARPPGLKGRVTVRKVNPMMI